MCDLDSCSPTIATVIPFNFLCLILLSVLLLKIYVYDENEIDGLRQLLYGRDGKISADSCLKGQWGTQDAG
ncbi:hypothetical protein L2E82_08858 [Cichorium intybus]|uniref:Uncharacterized protein n=1 Tax=Cichorium intybus TaxID=13427 RepID=A0ACB9G834_CICIN|nr:hypothetical protein L2E82_08858 [Cichorium intybus]